VVGVARIFFCRQDGRPRVYSRRRFPGASDQWVRLGDRRAQLRGYSIREPELVLN